MNRHRRHRFPRWSARLVAGAAIAAAIALAGAPPAAADNCSSPDDCERTAGYNTVIAVVGGIAAVAAAAAAAAAATSASNAAAAAGAAAGADGATGTGDDPPPPDIVIIQIDPGEIDVTPDTSGQFRVTAWRVKDGQPVRAPTVPLSVSAASDPALQVSPNQGTGEMVVVVTLVGRPVGDTARITASGTAAGGTASQIVTVHLGGGYDLEIY